MVTQQFIESPFYRGAAGQLHMYGDLLERPAEETILSALPMLDKGEFTGLTLYILGLNIEDPFGDLKRGMPLDAFLKWVDRNPNGFKPDRGGQLYAAVVAGIAAAAAGLDEIDKTELRLEDVSYRSAIATFYHTIALEVHDDTAGHTPLQVASYRMEAFFADIFDDYQSGLTDTAVRAFWKHFGFEMAPGYYPAVWW